MITVTDNIRKAIEHILEYMEKEGKPPSTVKQYRQTYDSFYLWLSENCITIISEKACIEFIEERTGYRIGELPLGPLPRTVQRKRRPLHILRNYLDIGEIDLITPIVAPRSHICPECFHEEFLLYLDLCATRGNAERTLTKKQYALIPFLEYLEKSGVVDSSDISFADTAAYLISIDNLAAKSKCYIVGTLRNYLSFLGTEGLTDPALATRLPKQRHTRHGDLPHIWHVDEIKALLAVIDRKSAIGKRDYAMILIAAKLGLRASDIRALEITSFDWTAHKICVTMQKTGHAIELPLLDDVGWAVIDYLKNGRPETTSTRVFVRHRAPFDNFGGVSSIDTRLYRYCRLAGLDFPDGRRHGLHSLRSALAKTLLENDICIPVISEVLGHQSTKTTGIYLKTAVENLRICSLDTEEAFDGK